VVIYKTKALYNFHSQIVELIQTFNNVSLQLKDETDAVDDLVV